MVSYCKHIRVRLLFSGVVLFLALFMGTVVGICSDSSLCVAVWGEVCDREDVIVGYIGFSENLFEISGGDSIAFLVTLEVSDGWCMEKMEEDGQDPYVNVTVAISADCRRAAVLLDGIPTVDVLEKIPVVRLTGEGNIPCTLKVDRGEYGEEGIYCQDLNGEVRVIPVDFLSASDPETTETSDVTDTGVESHYTTQVGELEEKTTADPIEEIQWGDPMDKPNVLFIGCRESQTKNGTYAVQFLFWGQEAYTPVICFSDGTVLSIRITEEDIRLLAGKEDIKPLASSTDKHLYACTFLGLSADKKVVFFVTTPEGVVRVSYRDGVFEGFLS